MCFLMIFIEEHGLSLRDLVWLFIKSDIFGEGSSAEKVVIFIEVDFDGGEGC